MFSEKAEIMKADFFGAYQINYDNMPLGYYGNGSYTFQYAKDTLVAIKVEFTFESKDTAIFRRLYNQLMNDFNKDKSKKLLKQYSDLNTQKIVEYVNAQCVTNTKKDDINYKPIKTKFLGQGIWGIYNNNIYTGKFLRAYVELSESHHHKTEFLGTTKTTTGYDGAKIGITLELSSERFQDLNSEAERLEITKYEMLNETDNQIKLIFENGIYLVPVKLNNTLSMNFILDPGAADVSISPDIFLVLYRAGTIDDYDFVGSQTYQFADGTTAKSNVFNIKSIKIGDIEIKNVRASINNSISAPLLLGQSALKKFDNYRIDNSQKLLILN